MGFEEEAIDIYSFATKTFEHPTMNGSLGEMSYQKGESSSNFCSSALPQMIYTASPLSRKNIEGAKSARFLQDFEVFMQVLNGERLNN